MDTGSNPVRASKGKTMSVFDTPEFKKAFWEWFDALPTQERKRFQEYPADMAELNFYNRVYRNLVDNDDSSLY